MVSLTSVCFAEHPQIKDTAGGLLLDGRVEVTQNLKTDKSLELINISTPPSPPLNHAFLYYLANIHDVKAIFDDGSNVSLTTTGAGTITNVIAGLGLVGGGTQGAVRLDLIPNSTNYIQNSTSLVSETASMQGSSSTGFTLRVSTANTGYHMQVSTNGHIESNGPSPTVSSCGSNPSVIGSDNSGTITVGSGVSVTACTMTFSQTWGSTPVCVISDNSVAITGDVSSISATAVTFSFSASLGSGQIYYICSCSGSGCI